MRYPMLAMGAVLFATSGTALPLDAQSPPPPGAFDAAPYLGEIRDDFLYGDVWERSGLSPRDRSLITIAVTQSQYATDQVRIHIDRGLDNGLTQEEIAEAIAHTLVYAGFPTGVNAARMATEVFRERGLPERPGGSTARIRDPLAPPAYPGAFPATPYLSELLNEWVYGEVWERPDLAKRDRSLISIAVAQAMGAASELRAHVGRGLDNGLTPEEIAEVLVHVAFYAGFPSAMMGSEVVAAVLASRDLPVPDADFPGAPYLDTLVEELLNPTWARAAELSLRERSLLAIAATQAAYQTDELRRQLERALAAGLTPDELAEAIAHLTLYTGFPRGVNASRTSGSVLQEAGVELPLDE